MALDIAKLSETEVGPAMDAIVAEIGGLDVDKIKTVTDSLKLAAAINNLRQFFKHPSIRNMTESLQDTQLGFLTDRSPAAINKAQRDGKPLKPYTYEDVADCNIEAMISGYRQVGNEFNIISGKMYPAKNGKFRKIIQHPGVTEFKTAVMTPQYISDGKFARIQCFASWKQDGAKVTIGSTEKEGGIEDTLVFTVRVNASMGEDAVVGKATSKLYSRVLMRLSGRALPEATDLEFGGPIALPEPAHAVTMAPVGEPPLRRVELPEEVATVQSGAPTVEELREQVTALAEKAGIPSEASEVFESRYIQDRKTTWKKEADLDTLALIVEQSEFVVADMRLKWKKWETEIKEYLNALKTGKSTEDYDSVLAKEYIAKRGKGFEEWVVANLARIPSFPSNNLLEIRQKWERLTKKKPFPLDMENPIADDPAAGKKPWKMPNIGKVSLGNDVRLYRDFFDKHIAELATMDNPKFLTVEAFTAWFVDEHKKTMAEDNEAKRSLRYPNIEQYKAAILVYGRFDTMIDKFLAS